MSAKNPTKSTSRPRTVLLVDDHPLLREGVAMWINRESDLKVCGEVETAPEAMRAIERHRPDLVIADLSLTSGDGLELIKDIRAQHPRLPILVLSVHEETLYAGRVLQAGAQGYLMKKAGGAKVLESIRTLLDGGISLSGKMSDRLLREYAGRPSRGGSSVLGPLTDREFEIFQLLGQAKSNREIAEHLHLSPKTVETHRVNIRNKLKLKTSMEVMRFAIRFVEQGASAK